VVEDVTGVLEALGCYRRRDEAFRALIPEYGPGWRAKIVLPPITGGDSFRVYSVVARSPRGDEVRVRVTVDAYRRIVAATNFKQRVRKTLEYYHADRLDYAVAGTPNRLEYELGFFVKNGDGSADVKPIAELYKTQVYRLAASLDIPEEIRTRIPTTDTYPLAQEQRNSTSRFRSSRWTSPCTRGRTDIRRSGSPRRSAFPRLMRFGSTATSTSSGAWPRSSTFRR
jgi:NAD+ synthase